MSRIMTDGEREDIQMTSVSTDDPSTPNIETPSLHSLDVEPFIPNGNSNNYIHHNQVRAIAFRRIWGLLLTVLLVLLIIALMAIWEQKGYVSNSEKITYNFFSTVLTITLGLNFSVSLILNLRTRLIIESHRTRSKAWQV